MFEQILAYLVSAIWPAIPAWLVKFLGLAIQATVKLVQGLKAEASMSGHDKRAYAIQSLGTLLDDGMDDIPEWKELGEDQRDRILNGMVELALFIDDVVTGHKHGKRNINRVLRQIRKEAGLR